MTIDAAVAAHDPRGKSKAKRRPKWEGKPPLTAERLRSVLSYERATGIFVWRVDLGKMSGMVGRVAGATHSKGYVQIAIDGRLYLARRLAWLYENGSWPAGQLDHRDLDKTNNAIGNLRAATNSQNNANTTKPNLTGFKGVAASRNGERYTAQITKDRRRIYLGTFNTAEEAHRAYAVKAKEVHGEFARTEAPGVKTGPLVSF